MPQSLPALRLPLQLNGMRSSANVRYDQFPCPATVVLSEPSQHLRHPGTADAEVTGECRPALEVAGVEQRLVVTGEVERIGTRFPGSLGTRFRLEWGSRGVDGDDR